MPSASCPSPHPLQRPPFAPRIINHPSLLYPHPQRDCTSCLRAWTSPLLSFQQMNHPPSTEEPLLLILILNRTLTATTTEAKTRTVIKIMLAVAVAVAQLMAMSRLKVAHPTSMPLLLSPPLQTRPATGERDWGCYRLPLKLLVLPPAVR